MDAEVGGGGLEEMPGASRCRGGESACMEDAFRLPGAPFRTSFFRINKICESFRSLTPTSLLRKTWHFPCFAAKDIQIGLSYSCLSSML